MSQIKDNKTYNQKEDNNEWDTFFKNDLEFPDNYDNRRKGIDRFIRSREYAIRLYPSERFKSSRKTLWGYVKENSLFFSLFIVFGIVVINSWQTYIATSIAFGASGLADIVAALLFGFGSQTILTKGVEVAQKWAVNRSKPEIVS